MARNLFALVNARKRPVATDDEYTLLSGVQTARGFVDLGVAAAENPTYSGAPLGVECMTPQLNNRTRDRHPSVATACESQSFPRIRGY